MRRCHATARPWVSHCVSLWISLCASLCLSVAAPALAFETEAGSAFVFDVTTDTVLLEKNAEVPLPPASMSKLMTLNMLFEALEDGRVQMETQFAVSQRAMDMGGSTMFLTTADRPTVEELIKGIIVMSGNDACVVVAEGLAGSEEAFAEMMTERARALGMENSTFANASGWPHPSQRMSMRDLAILATRLIEQFPELYDYFALTEFAFDGRAPDNRFNRNPLLSLGLGADGLKTGHTSEAGYGLVGSAVQGGRRVVFVISGLDSEAARRSEATSILNWAFRQFALRTPVRAGEIVTQVPVWLGDADTVALTPTQDIELLMPVTVREGIQGVVDWTGPVEAPIAAGQEIALFTVSRDGMSDTVVPLVAATSVGRAGFLPRFGAAAGQVLDMARDLTGIGAGDDRAGDPAGADPVAVN